MKTRITTRATRPTTTAVHAPLRRVRLSPGSASGPTSTSRGGVLSIVNPLLYVGGSGSTWLMTTHEVGGDNDQKNGQAGDPESYGGGTRKSRRRALVANRP